jgi:hypothetical protein
MVIISKNYKSPFKDVLLNFLISLSQWEASLLVIKMITHLLIYMYSIPRKFSTFFELRGWHFSGWGTKCAVIGQCMFSPFSWYKWCNIWGCFSVSLAQRQSQKPCSSERFVLIVWIMLNTPILSLILLSLSLNSA